MSDHLERPNYGNWVSSKLLYIPAAAGVLLGALSFLFPVVTVLSLPCLIVFFYFGYARYRFSSRGGDVQARIQALVLERLDWEGRGTAIDIGCGNGAIAIAMAKKFPGSRVMGID